MINIRQRRKNIISLTGTPCSGKSTLNTLLTKELNTKELPYQSYSLGTTVKKLAESAGIDPETFYEHSSKCKNIVIDGKEQSLDAYLDNFQKELGEKENNFVIDSRLSFYFIPQSFRVSVLCALPVAAKRGYSKRKEQANYATLEQAEKTIEQRLRFEQNNFQEKYGIPDYRDPYHFDLVFDNTSLTAEEAVAQILEKYGEYQKRTEEIKIIARSFATYLAPEIEYVSSPISEGKLLYQYLQEKGLRFDEELKKEPDFVERVIKPNKQLAKMIGKQRKAQGKTVIVPAIFYRSGWSERDYLDLEIPLIENKINRILFVDGWEYSGGCIEEYLVAQQKGIPCFEQQGNILSTTKAKELVQQAMDDLTARGIGHDKMKELYVKMR